MKLNPYLAIIIAVSLGAFNAVLVKWLDLSPVMMTFLRLATPTVIMGVALRVVFKKRIAFKNAKPLLVASLLNTIRILFYYLAFRLTTVGNGTIILYIWPIFATLFGALFLKEKTRLSEYALIFLAFLGVSVMFSNEHLSFANKDIVGMLLMMGSAAIYAGTIIIYKKYTEAYSPAEFVFYQNCVGGVLLLPVLFFTDQAFSVRDAAIASGYFGVIVGIGAFLLVFSALKRLSTIRFSLIHYFEVVAGVLYGVLFLGESLSFTMLVGGLLIILAGWLLIRGRPTPPPVVVE